MFVCLFPASDKYPTSSQINVLLYSTYNIKKQCKNFSALYEKLNKIIRKSL